MNETRVLLSIEGCLEQQLIVHSLERLNGVKIVGQSTNAIETLALIVQRKPHLWIHSFKDASEYGAVHAFVQELAPELLTAVIQSGDSTAPRSYLQVPVKSIGEIVSLAVQLAEHQDSMVA